jgi:hypothetical protein
VVGWVAAEGGEDELVDFHPEEMEGLGRLLALLRMLLPDEPVEGLLVGDLLGPAGELCIATCDLGVDRGAVQRQCGSRWRSFALRESGIMPSQRSPSRNDAS